MTTSRTSLLAAVFLMTAAWAGAQSQPQSLPWAVAELAGGGEWAVRFPQLLVQGWDTLPDHILSDDEKTALRRAFVDQTLVSLQKETSRLKLDLDKKRLAGDLPSNEPAATEKSLADLEAKRSKTAAGTPEAEPPATLPFKPVWAAGRDSLPWSPGSRTDFLGRSKALYLVTGTVRIVGSYLAIEVELYSDIEKKVLSRWEGRFAPDEAPSKAVEAADQFRTVLLGRPWAGLSVASAVGGSQVFALAQWHNLPWSSDEFSPGTLDLKVRNPGRPEESRTVDLSPGVRTTLRLEDDTSSADTIVLETQPPGVSLYLDSRYLGPSPQTVERPLATTRVRAQSPGWATAAWEIGPSTVSPSLRVMKVPEPLPSVPQAKDRFYLSLAAFSFSLTGSAFVGAWQDEQVRLTNAYATAGATAGYLAARERYQWMTAGYAASVVLTSGVFVWMMFELGDYLGAAQASLP